MAGVNKVILIGRLGKTPELRKTNGGNSVVDFSIATSEKYTDKQGQRQEQTEWHNVVAFGKTAELCSQYLNKGSQAFIEGKLKTDSWEDNGVKKFKTSIVVSNVQFLDSVQQNQQQQGNGFNQMPEQGFNAPQQNYQQDNRNTQFDQMPPSPQGLPDCDELPF